MGQRGKPKGAGRAAARAPDGTGRVASGAGHPEGRAAAGADSAGSGGRGGSGDRSGGAGVDVRLALLLLVLANTLTVVIWFAHRSITGVAAGVSTSRVVDAGALFGSLSAMVEAFRRTPRGRAWLPPAWLGVAIVIYLGVRSVTGTPDGSLPADAAPAIIGLGTSSLLFLALIRLWLGRRPRTGSAEPATGPAPQPATGPAAESVTEPAPGPATVWGTDAATGATTGTAAWFGPDPRARRAPDPAPEPAAEPAGSQVWWEPAPRWSGDGGREIMGEEQ